MKKILIAVTAGTIIAGVVIVLKALEAFPMSTRRPG